MTLAAGQDVGPFRILRLLGAGGMGEVYVAMDPSLGREVALKVLPADFAEAPERLRRFDLEAKSLAQLSHPNVVQVYACGNHEGLPYLAMELLHGTTLRERIAEGGLSVKRIQDYARQIARGLAAAHDRGIIHRDLKPDNILVTREGVVKILDFGLAKNVPAPLGGDPSQSTLPDGPGHAFPTQEGVILGTLLYMAPEQIRGEGIDIRTDIFAFGVVLHELLSGKPPFKGETGVETLSAILRKDPPDLPPGIPATLSLIVNRCLAKNPLDRFRSAHDLVFALEHFSSSHSSLEHRLAPGRPFPDFRLRAQGPLLALGLALGALLGWLATRPPAVVLQQVFQDKCEVVNARFMPDGQAVVFSATRNGLNEELFLQAGPGSAPRPMAVQGSLLSVSPTGDLALLVGKAPGDTEGDLAILPASGGAPRKIAEGVSWAEWGPDGTNLIIKWARYQGKRAMIITWMDRKLVDIQNRAHDFGAFVVSPQRDAIAFIENVMGGPNGRGLASLVVVGLDGQVRSRAPLKDSQFQGLVWGKEGLVALQTTEQARDITNLVRIHPGSGKLTTLLPHCTFGDLPDVSAQGDYLVTPGGFSGDFAAANWQKPGGKGPDLFSWGAGVHGRVFLAEDGGRMAFTSMTGWHWGTFVVSAQSPIPTRLGDGSAMAISGDGNWVLVFPIGQKAKLIATGSGEERTLPESWFHATGSLSRDGSRALIVGRQANMEGPAAWLAETPQGTLRKLDGPIRGPLSPDGHWAFKAGPGPDAPLRLTNLDTGEERPLPAALKGKQVTAWGSGARALLLTCPAPGQPHAFEVWSCDLKTQALTRTGLVPAPTFLVEEVTAPTLSADAKAWANAFSLSSPVRTSLYRLHLN